MRDPTILLVEDNDGFRGALRALLEESFPECHVREVVSGEEAVSAVSSRAPDLVLMDVGLPGMNGVEATRRIKAAAADTYVVILSVQEAEEYQADAMGAGAAAYLFKRQTYRELVPVLAELLHGVSREPGEPPP